MAATGTTVLLRKEENGGDDEDKDEGKRTGRSAGKNIILQYIR